MFNAAFVTIESRTSLGKQRGTTITEMVVCLAIVGTLMGLMLPAVQSIRQSARDGVCKNNMRQMNLALEQVIDSSRRMPVWDQQSIVADGWSVAILPYIDPVYSTNVTPGLDIDSMSADFRRRPLVLTCPLVVETDDTDERMHYQMSPRMDRQSWFVIDAPIDATNSWLTGVELDSAYDGTGPHRGGFYRFWRRGEINFLPGIPSE